MKEKENSDFNVFKLCPKVLKGVQSAGYTTPTDIQRECIPPLLEGKDLVGLAKTGTGKTAGFALPTLTNIDESVREPQVLVLVPTRELALQVAKAFEVYAAHLEAISIVSIYGGSSMRDQLRTLKRGAQIVIGTPGRIMDHLRRGTLNLQSVRTVVLDEADEMLTMGFAEEVDSILEYAPSKRQVALFSATMPKSIRKIAEKHLHNPVEIKGKGGTEVAATINQLYTVTSTTQRYQALRRLLSFEPVDAAIVFVKTKVGSVNLAEKLEGHGFRVAALNGDLTQELRERTIQRLKDSTLDIIVATDVAARGIDVERVTHVFNYEIPEDPEVYIHRIGRTGRAGRQGTSYLMLSPNQSRFLQKIEKTSKSSLTRWDIPSDDALREKRLTKLQKRISRKLRGEVDSVYSELAHELCASDELSSEQLTSVLLQIIDQPDRIGPVDRLDFKESGPRSEQGNRSRKRGRQRRPSSFSSERKGQKNRRKKNSRRRHSR